MTRRPVKSSFVKSVGHEGNVLEVELANGTVHTYTGVSREIHDHLLKAESIGARFCANIRGRYPHVCTETHVEKK